jgi:hypothetical protein
MVVAQVKLVRRDVGGQFISPAGSELEFLFARIRPRAGLVFGESSACGRLQWDVS